uniref:Uncharacterized protein n=1 Tax=Heterorhabditis bacteriophora TaxID=37862 RepID=A0A1I7XCK0_HETBA
MSQKYAVKYNGQNITEKEILEKVENKIKTQKKTNFVENKQLRKEEHESGELSHKSEENMTKKLYQQNVVQRTAEQLYTAKHDLTNLRNWHDRFCEHSK